MKKRITAAVLSAVFMLSAFSGCSSVKAENLTDKIKPNPVPVYNQIDGEQTKAVAEFSAQLLKQLSVEDKSVVYSPLSVLYALAMTANGADGQTLAQMEAVLGMEAEELNSYLHNVVNLLPSDVGYDFDIANSIWVKDDANKFVVKEEFLQTVKDYYLAQIFTAAFDKETLKDINNWVVQATNGQIQNILDDIDSDAVMYLINALNFEAQWADVYEEFDVREGTFTHSDGTEQMAEFMYSEEHAYLSDENTTGVIKYYKGGKYGFVALMPDKDTDINSYIQSIDGEKITNLLANVQDKTVWTAIPKYENTFDIEMSDIFKTLGMTDAFDSAVADFSRMGTPQVEGENLCINHIIHKAFIRVAEQGTQAGASTVVEMITEGAMLVEDPKEVYLDRPFVYMVIDTQNNLPLFMGTVCEIE